jgi:hypothetical protein
MLRTILLCLTATTVVGLTGLAHGLRTGRWQTSRAVESAVAGLSRVPMDVGDWKGEAVEVEAHAFAHVGADGFLVRRYQNRLTGRTLSVMLVGGLPGPISVHSPDVCYSGAGYEVVAPPGRVAVAAGAGESAEFLTGKFRKTNAVVPSQLRIFWAWHAPGGGWSAPDNPRWTFARSPALFKLYVIREMASPDERPEDDPALEFLRQLLPRLENL